MERLFIRLLQMSLAGGIVILGVLLLRLFLRLNVTVAQEQYCEQDENQENKKDLEADMFIFFFPHISILSMSNKFSQNIIYDINEENKTRICEQSSLLLRRGRL